MEGHWGTGVNKYLLCIKRGTGVEKNFRIKHAQVWAVQGWVTSWVEGHGGGEELWS